MHKKIIVVFLCFFMFSSKPLIYAQEKESGRFSFAVIGCMHLGICDSKEYESAVRDMKSYNPDFVSLLGGMVDPMGEKSVESLWREFDSITAKLGVAVYDVPGECRLSPLFIPPERLALMKGCFLERYNEPYYSFAHKNNLFIYLDSDNILDEARGLIRGKQLSFLKKAVSDASRYDNVFIFMHGSEWLQYKDEWFKNIHPLIKGKVNYVFGAGMHFLDSQKLDGVTYITSGFPSCYPEGSPSTEKPFFPHFLIVGVDKKDVSVDIVPLGPIPLKNLMPYQEEQGLPRDVKLVKHYLVSAPERGYILDAPRIIDTLKIKPGMNILDIGAGKGLFTFRFADALKGNGRVFATDTDRDMIEYVKKGAEKGSYKNVFPVLVNSEGLDPFYKQYTFDIIFLSEVYQYLHNPRDFLRELRPSLAKDNGRLYLIHFRNVSDFSEIEFEDFRKIPKTLILKGGNFPVFLRLSDENKIFVKNWRGNDIAPLIRTRIIRDLNKMLADRFLLNDLIDYYGSRMNAQGERENPFEELFSENDLQLGKWLIVGLQERKVFDKRKENISDTDERELRKLNRLLLTNVFQTRILEFLKGDYLTYAEKSSVISDMEESGYQLVREYNFLTQYYFLEFKRKF